MERLVWQPLEYALKPALEYQPLEKRLRKHVDLAEIEWNLSFPCPGSGEAIFPEDRPGRHYDLLEIKIRESVVKEVVIQCTRCGGIIHLALDQSTTGFPASFVLTRNDVDSDMLRSRYSISYG